MIIAIDIREAIGMKTGKGYYTYNIVRELIEIDSENEYILYSDKDTDLFEESENVTHKSMPISGFMWHYSVLKDAQYEEADIFFAPTSFIIPALHNPGKIKVVVTIHDLIAFLFPSTHSKKAVFIERLTLKRSLDRSAAIVCVSENTKKDLIDMFYLEEEKVHVIPNAASSIFQVYKKEDLEDFGETNRVPDNYIFAAATLEPRKNFPFIIEAFAEVCKNFPDLKLLIAGKKGWYYKEIFQTVKDNNLEEKVVFLGFVNEYDLPKYYNLAKIFVYPSLYEGFGLQPLEAMQCGCPVITSNISSLPEVTGDAAILIDPEDRKAFVSAIEDLLTNENKRKELIEKGFLQAQKFSWKNSAKRLLHLFEEIK